jgi:acetyl esterase
VAAKAVTTFLLDLVKGEPAGFAIAGESAGANLAIASLLEDAELREACRSVTLLYPFLDLSLSRPSVTELGEGYFLTKKMLEWFVKSYLREGADPSDPGASPIFASGIAELPPTLIIVGEFDPLLDDAREAHRLIPGSELKVVPGMLHGFLQMRKVIGARAKYLRIIGNFIARH